MLFKRLLRHAQRLRSYQRFFTKRQKRIIRVSVILAAVLFFTVIFLFRLQPLVAKMAVSAASESVTKAVNTAVNEKISDGSIDYSNLIMFEKDTDGHISALTTNMPKINILQTQIVARVIELLDEKRINELNIPVGNLIGGNVFSGRGFDIPVKIVSVGATSANFSNKFISAGINQTRHQIVLEVSVDINILIPAKIVKSTIKCEISVAETIIVGDVPESYTFFEDNGEASTVLEKYDIAN